MAGGSPRVSKNFVAVRVCVQSLTPPLSLRDVPSSRRRASELFAIGFSIKLLFANEQKATLTSPSVKPPSPKVKFHCSRSEQFHLPQANFTCAKRKFHLPGGQKKPSSERRERREATREEPAHVRTPLRLRNTLLHALSPLPRLRLVFPPLGGGLCFVRTLFFNKIAFCTAKSYLNVPVGQISLLTE